MISEKNWQYLVNTIYLILGLLSFLMSGYVTFVANPHPAALSGGIMLAYLLSTFYCWDRMKEVEE